jgi:hypothetical protein
MTDHTDPTDPTIAISKDADMSNAQQILETLAGEQLHLRHHPTGPYRYDPIEVPTKSKNANLWRTRANGGWHHDPAVAAIALAFDLGLRQGRAEGAPPPKVVGKVEAQVVAAVQALAAAGGEVSTSMVIEKTTLSMTVPAGQRDRRHEFARRALIGLVKRGAPVVADDGTVTACLTRDAA